MAKAIKTNVLRHLDALKIPYETREYTVDDDNFDGKLVAEKVDLPAGMIYKTLVLVGDTLPHLVCVIPVELELDLKAVARAAGCKTGTMQLVLAIFTGLTIVVGMKMMGAIMISALILFPPMAAMQLCGSFRRTVVTAAAIAMASCLIGFTLACTLSLQTGATVVTVQLAVFLACAGIGTYRRVRRA